MSGVQRMVGAAALLPAALLTALLAAPATAPAAPSPALAHAQGGVFVQVNPNTIQAGYQVGIHASCGEDLNPATVRSRAFGEVTLTPLPGSRFLQGSATVPSDTRAGQYEVDLRCANGNRAQAELFVLGMSQPTRGPNTGGGGALGGGGPVVPAPLLVGGVSAAALAAGIGLLRARRRPS
ncbi:MAG TPA: hypothetical protein VIL37_11985 [Natronosporangium sp.]